MNKFEMTKEPPCFSYGENHHCKSTIPITSTNKPTQLKKTLKMPLTHNNIIVKIDHIKKKLGNDFLFFRLDKGKIGAMIGFYSCSDNTFHKTYQSPLKNRRHAE